MSKVDVQGTYEILTGTGLGEFGEGGQFEFEGSTSLHWDGAESVTDDDGNPVVWGKDGVTYAVVPREGGVAFLPVVVEIVAKVIRLAEGETT